MSSSGRFTTSVGSIRRGKRLALAFRLLVALLMLIFALGPVVWIISASFNPTNSLVGQPLIPPNPTLGNYTALWNDELNPFPVWLWNSLMLATITTVVAVMISTLAAYAFSRFRFGSRQTLLRSILLIQVFPNFLNMVALFLILQQFGFVTLQKERLQMRALSQSFFGFPMVPYIGLNTHAGLLLLYLGGALGVNTWLTKGYFDSIPRDLDEAAKMDGASHWQTFSRVIMPLVRPILVVVGLLTFIGVYSEYVLARIILTDKYLYTMAVGLNLFSQNQYAGRWGVFCAGAIIAALPVVVLFMIFQRYLDGGLTTGAVKG